MRRVGKEGRRKEEEVGKGETASQRGEKGEVGLEVANMQLTSRLARSLERQVIRRIPSLLKHNFLMTMAI